MVGRFLIIVVFVAASIAAVRNVFCEQFPDEAIQTADNLYFEKLTKEYTEFATLWQSGKIEKCEKYFSKSDGQISLDNAVKLLGGSAARTYITGDSEIEKWGESLKVTRKSRWIVQTGNGKDIKRTFQVTEEILYMTQGTKNGIITHYGATDVTKVVVDELRKKIAISRNVFEDPSQELEKRIFAGIDIFGMSFDAGDFDAMWPVLRELNRLQLKEKSQARFSLLIQIVEKSEPACEIPDDIKKLLEQNIERNKK